MPIPMGKQLATIERICDKAHVPKDSPDSGFRLSTCGRVQLLADRKATFSAQGTLTGRWEGKTVNTDEVEKPLNKAIVAPTEFPDPPVSVHLRYHFLSRDSGHSHFGYYEVVRGTPSDFRKVYHFLKQPECFTLLSRDLGTEFFDCNRCRIYESDWVVLEDGRHGSVVWDILKHVVRFPDGETHVDLQPEASKCEVLGTIHNPPRRLKA